jgi:hypothetical protein
VYKKNRRQRRWVVGDPLTLFSVSIESKGVMRTDLVSIDSKGVMRTDLVSIDSKGT